MYKIGSVILVRFPFTNLINNKLRPALIIGEYKNDFIILAISSNKYNGINYDINNSNLSSGKLLINSYIKINKITSIEKGIIYSKIGTVQNIFLKKVKDNFIHKILN